MTLGQSTLQKILDYEDLSRIRQKHKDQKIAFVSGCYDIFQSGHGVFFEQAKQYADVLVVGLGSDRVIKELKSKPEDPRPVNPQNNRAYVVAQNVHVDYAIINDEPIQEGKINFKRCLELLRPDYFILNDDDGAIKEKRALCDLYHIKVELVKRIVPAYLTATSTTEIIRKSRG